MAICAKNAYIIIINSNFLNKKIPDSYANIIRGFSL